MHLYHTLDTIVNSSSQIERITDYEAHHYAVSSIFLLSHNYFFHVFSSGPSIPVLSSMQEPKFHNKTRQDSEAVPTTPRNRMGTGATAAFLLKLG
jgi:hypothetical protein